MEQSQASLLEASSLLRTVPEVESLQAGNGGGPYHSSPRKSKIVLG